MSRKATFVLLRHKVRSFVPTPYWNKQMVKSENILTIMLIVTSSTLKVGSLAFFLWPHIRNNMISSRTHAQHSASKYSAVLITNYPAIALNKSLRTRHAKMWNYTKSPPIFGQRPASKKLMPPLKQLPHREPPPSYLLGLLTSQAMPSHTGLQ